MSSDDEFKETYGGIAEEETSEPLEVENTDTIQAKMPSGNESKPNKSICKALSAHLSLLRDRVAELDDYLDGSEANQTVGDHEIDTIKLKSDWIEAKFNKILDQWEEFLDSDYDDAERARAEPTYKECVELSSKVRRRADTFITKAPRAAQAASGPAKERRPADEIRLAGSCIRVFSD